MLSLSSHFYIDSGGHILKIAAAHDEQSLDP